MRGIEWAGSSVGLPTWRAGSKCPRYAGSPECVLGVDGNGQGMAWEFIETKGNAPRSCEEELIA